MAKAYVLITTDPDVEDEFIKDVKKIEGVVEASAVYGIYDFIIIEEAETMEKGKKIITLNIRRLRDVKGTITLISVGS